MDKYQTMYDKKLYLLDEFMFGEEEDTSLIGRAKTKVAADIKRRQAKLRKNLGVKHEDKVKIEDYGGLSMMQESSYYLAMIAKLYTQALPKSSQYFHNKAKMVEGDNDLKSYELMIYPESRIDKEKLLNDQKYRFSEVVKPYNPEVYFNNTPFLY
jgi:hypothetical protein